MGDRRMKTTISKHASYIYVKEWDDSFRPLKTKTLTNGIYLDYNKDDELVGIEILHELVPEYTEEK
jgi:uncharacterized protein YuzE